MPAVLWFKLMSWSRTRYLYPVFQIRILGSIHLITNPDPALFVSGFQETKKIRFFLSFSAYYQYFMQVHLHQSSKIAKIVFLWKDSDPDLHRKLPIRIQEAQKKHSTPYLVPVHTWRRTRAAWIRMRQAQKHSAPDPDHCLYLVPKFNL